MQVSTPRDLKIGRILEVAFDIIEQNAAAAIGYVAGLTTLTAAIAFFGADYDSFTQVLGKQFITFLIGVVAAFLLLASFLRQGGYLQRPVDEAFLPFVGLSILTAVGVMIGFILIVFPGLYLMSRWLLAPSLLIARGHGVIDAMKESWERTGGSEFSIIVIVMILLLVQVGGGLMATQSFGAGSPAGIAVAQFIGTATSIVSTSVGVALYKLLVVDRDLAVGKTFA